MQPSTRGLVVLTAAVVLGSCSSDPTDNLRGEAKVVATPATVAVNQGATEFVTVEAVDETGSSIAADFTVQNVGPGITVVRDTTFLPTAGGPLQTNARFAVTGVSPAASSFEIVAGGAAPDTVPVNVVPTGTGIPVVTVASAGPTASDPTVLTVPAPFIFFEDPAVGTDAGTAIVTERSADGRSLTVLAPPGTTTAASAQIAAEYLPTVPIPTTTDVALTVSPTVTAIAGTNSPATAPEIPIPAPGTSGGFFDAGTFGAATCGGNSGAPCQLYKFTLPADGSFDATLNWSNTADLGLYITSADGNTDMDQFCDDLGNAEESQPEACTITLPAGTYLATVVSFGPFYDPADPNPAWIGLSLSTPAE